MAGTLPHFCKLVLDPYVLATRKPLLQFVNFTRTRLVTRSARIILLYCKVGVPASVVKVADMGIAKLLAPDRTSTTKTSLGQPLASTSCYIRMII